jgi:hypothetical protein
MTARFVVSAYVLVSCTLPVYYKYALKLLFFSIQLCCVNEDKTARAWYISVSQHLLLLGVWTQGNHLSVTVGKNNHFKNHCCRLHFSLRVLIVPEVSIVFGSLFTEVWTQSLPFLFFAWNHVLRSSTLSLACLVCISLLNVEIS